MCVKNIPHKNIMNKQTISPKIQILTKNSNFDNKFKFWQKIQILTKNSNFDKKFKFWPGLSTENDQHFFFSVNFGPKFANFDQSFKNIWSTENDQNFFFSPKKWIFSLNFRSNLRSNRKTEVYVLTRKILNTLFHGIF